MESRSHFSFRLQNRLSGLAKRRNGLHSSCIQLAYAVALGTRARAAAIGAIVIILRCRSVHVSENNGATTRVPHRQCWIATIIVVV